jgi:demethylmenaquinone methyltransferase/2-methoxy-6-polyprenyl-1,4-benzoquinol methylase
VPRLGALLSSPDAYTYLPQSIFKFPPPHEFALEMEAAGFDRPNARPFTFGACHLFLAVNPG